MKRTNKRAGVVLAVLLLSMFYFCGCSEDVAPSIEVSPNTIEVDCGLQSIPIQVSTTKEWKAKIVYQGVEGTMPAENEWCHLSKDSGYESGNINIIVDEFHNEITERSVIIYFETPGSDYEVATIRLLQRGEDSWAESK